MDYIFLAALADTLVFALLTHRSVFFSVKGLARSAPERAKPRRTLQDSSLRMSMPQKIYVN